PALHGVHTPPQSTSLSEPFFTLSSHLGTAQAIAAQMWLTQSPEIAHFLPVPHPPQEEPPQSTSVSEPFSMVSAHANGTQMLDRQIFSMQSLPTAHAL